MRLLEKRIVPKMRRPTRSRSQQSLAASLPQKSASDSFLRVTIGRAPPGDPLADLVHSRRDLWDARGAEKPSNRESRARLSISQHSLQLELPARGGDL